LAHRKIRSQTRSGQQETENTVGTTHCYHLDARYVAVIRRRERRSTRICSSLRGAGQKSQQLLQTGVCAHRELIEEVAECNRDISTVKASLLVRWLLYEPFIVLQYAGNFHFYGLLPNGRQHVGNALAAVVLCKAVCIKGKYGA